MKFSSLADYFCQMDLIPDLADKWVKLTFDLRERFGKNPDLNAVLFLIGINEVGLGIRKFKKEEKMDLMHVAICRLLSNTGHYKFIGVDEDGWPHYEMTKEPDFISVFEQEMWLKNEAVKYFETL